MATRALAPSAQVTGGFKLDAFVDRHFMWIGLALFLQGGPGDTIEWGARMAAGVMVIVPSLIFFRPPAVASHAVWPPARSKAKSGNYCDFVIEH